MKILKKIGLICCAILLGIGSVFLPRLAKTQSYIAKADYTDTNPVFTSSNAIFTRVGYMSSSSISTFKSFDSNWLSAVYFNHSFSIDYSAFHIRGYVKGLFNSSWYFGTSLNQNNFLTCGDYNVENTSYIASNVSVPIHASSSTYYTRIQFFVDKFDYATNSYVDYYQAIDWNNYENTCPTLLMTQVQYGNYTDYGTTFNLYGDNKTYWDSQIDSSTLYNYLQYTDTHDYRYTFIIPLCRNSGENYQNSPANYYTYRVYYFSTALSLTDSQQYNAGYNQGLLDNQNTIYQEGRQDGFNGGYNQGYDEGVSAASNNNFFTLIGAAVDVPITALTSLLNFTFLGVNLLAFVTSILTLALIIFVIKKFMGKG